MASVSLKAISETIKKKVPSNVASPFKTATIKRKMVSKMASESTIDKIEIENKMLKQKIEQMDKAFKLEKERTNQERIQSRKVFSEQDVRSDSNKEWMTQSLANFDSQVVGIEIKTEQTTVRQDVNAAY